MDVADVADVAALPGFKRAAWAQSGIDSNRVSAARRAVGAVDTGGVESIAGLSASPLRHRLQRGLQQGAGSPCALRFGLLPFGFAQQAQQRVAIQRLGQASIGAGLTGPQVVDCVVTVQQQHHGR